MSISIPVVSETLRPRSLWRWIPVSLRVFAALLVLLGGWSALGIGIPACRQQAAIREIERAGGKVEFRPRGPDWLRAIVGESLLKWLGDVESVDLSSSQADDATLANLKELYGLESLILADTRVTDAGLVHLSRLSNLESLSLTDTLFTDAGLVHLRRLVNLKTLFLSDTRVSDAGLEHMQGLTRLEWISLNRSAIRRRA